MTDYYFHETAIIDPGANIGKNSRVWHWTHICSGANIGDNVSLGQNVFVGNKVTIGNNCKIQNNVSIYDNVTLDEVYSVGQVWCSQMSVTPALIDRKSEYSDTLVGKGATLGANCTILCGISIGKFAFIGAGALINRNVSDYALVVGTPGRQIGWMSEFGNMEIRSSMKLKNSYVRILVVNTFLNME